MRRDNQSRNRSRFLGITFNHPKLGLINPLLLYSRSEPIEWDGNQDGLHPAFIQVMNEANERTPNGLRNRFFTLQPQLNPTAVVQHESPDAT
jgi:hypothetical protein